jgi:hypothetical protein
MLNRRRAGLIALGVVGLCGFQITSCGTLYVVAEGKADGAFPGVRYDLSTIGMDVTPTTNSEAESCATIVFVPLVVVHAALKLIDLPLSSIADLGLMLSRAFGDDEPSERDKEGSRSQESPTPRDEGFMPVNSEPER